MPRPDFDPHVHATVRRMLPRPIPPFPNERVDSYIRRLQIANGLHKPGLIPLIPLGQSAPAILQALTQLTGRDPHALTHALPELNTSQRHTGRETRQACKLCAARRADTQTLPISLYSPYQHTVCRRHRRWLGNQGAQIPLPPSPATNQILSANKHHRRLASQNTNALAAESYQLARFIIWRWLDHGIQFASITARLDDLLPHGKRPWPDQSPLHAAIYPNIITLTQIIAHPRWETIIYHDNPDEHETLWSKIAAEVTDGYRPTHHRDPLQTLINNRKYLLHLDRRKQASNLSNP